MPKQKINYNALISALLSFVALVSGAATAVQAGSYDPNRTDLNLLSALIPAAWLPHIFAWSAWATIIVRVWPHLAQMINNIFPYLNLPTTVPAQGQATPIAPQSGAIQPVITKQ